MEIKIKDKKYKVVKDYGDTIKAVNLDEIVTDYYDGFDYIVGDWAYNKVRLKGFYNHSNEKAKAFNDIDNLESYIEDNCAYGCKYFVLEKLKDNKVEKNS